MDEIMCWADGECCIVFAETSVTRKLDAKGHHIVSEA